MVVGGAGKIRRFRPAATIRPARRPPLAATTIWMLDLQRPADRHHGLLDSIPPQVEHNFKLLRSKSLP